jgi:tetratricopeptide (TPR) repeat protein
MSPPEFELHKKINVGLGIFQFLVNSDPRTYFGDMKHRTSLNLIITTSLLALLLIGCVHQSIATFQEALQAERAGDDTAAREGFWQAYAEAQAGKRPPAEIAYPLYGYARFTGYAGKHEEARKRFEDVLALIDQASPSADELRPPALCEYAYMLHDTGQHAKAVPFFERANIEVAKCDIMKTDPLGYAAFLDDFAASLGAAGKTDRATRIAGESNALKEANKNQKSKFVRRRYE